MTPVVTFDAGMTLVELDLDFLARRLAQRGIVVSPGALRAAAPAAWQHYDERVEAGGVHGRLWHELIGEIIAGPARRPTTVGGAVEWLWEQQTAQNLFRAPIPDMVALARRLARRRRAHGRDLELGRPARGAPAPRSGSRMRSST